MGWGIGDIGLTIATGGAYGAAKAYNDSQNSDRQDSYQNSLYNQNAQNWNQAMDFGKGLENKLYGDNLGKIPGNMSTIQDTVMGNLGKDTIKSDLYRQKQDSTISKANAKAGLSGIDTTAGKLQEDRNAATQAKAVNEEYKQQNLQTAMKMTSATQNAAASLWLGTMGMAMGSQQTPQPLQEKGILAELMGGLGL